MCCAVGQQDTPPKDRFAAWLLQNPCPAAPTVEQVEAFISYAPCSQVVKVFIRAHLEVVPPSGYLSVTKKPPEVKTSPT